VAGEADFMAAQAIAVSAEQSPLGLVEVSDGLHGAKRYEEAIAILDAVLAANPELGVAHCRRAAALAMLDRDEDALASADRAIAVSSGDDLAWANCIRAHALCALDDFPAGLEAAKVALKLKPSDPCAQMNMSWAYRGMGDFESARATAERAIEMAPDHEEPYRRLSEALVALGEYSPALVAINRSLQRDPENTKALIHRELVMELLGRD
jgi:tetratricopeptide (TPR) repeat protein